MSEEPTTVIGAISWHPNVGDWWRAYRRAPVAWLGFIVLAYFVVQGLSDIIGGYPAIGFGLLVLGPIPFLLLMAYRWRQFGRAATYDIVVTPDESGLRVDAGAAHITHDWPHLAARRDGSGVVVLAGGSRPVVRIPGRAFARPDDADAFVQLVTMRSQDAAAVA